jgi:hypothetical protein
LSSSSFTPSNSELRIRNDEVVGSIPTSSTNSLNDLRVFHANRSEKLHAYWIVMDHKLDPAATVAKADNCSSVNLHWLGVG